MCDCKTWLSIAVIGMSYCKIVIEGKNCWVNIDGAVRKLGFFTTRLGHASNASQAKEAVLLELSKELRSCLFNDSFDPPEITADEITEIGLTEATEIPGAGFTWYQEDAAPSN